MFPQVTIIIIATVAVGGVVVGISLNGDRGAIVRTMQDSRRGGRGLLLDTIAVCRQQTGLFVALSQHSTLQVGLHESRLQAPSGCKSKFNTTVMVKTHSFVIIGLYNLFM